MKVTNLLLAFVCFLLSVNACQNLVTPYHVDEVNLTKASYRTDVSFENAIEAFHLATIGLLENEDIISIIATQAIDDESDDRVSFQYIKNQASQISIDLIALMKYSVMANGGTSSQADFVEEYIGGFVNGTEFYVPFIYFPYSESASDASETAILTKGLEYMPTGNWYGDRYVNGTFDSTVTITQTLAQNTPLLIVTASSSDAGWLPWRRCWCTRDRAVIENGNHTGMSGMGSCRLTTGNSDAEDRCPRCGRSNFSGECSGDPCSGC